MAMKSRPLGRKGVVVGDRVRVVGDVVRRRRLAGPDRRGRRARHHAAPYGRRRRPGRAGHRLQRRPARRGHRAGRPRAAAAADRPRAGGGVRRRHGAAAVPHQGRPRRPGDAAVDLPLPRRAVGGDRARRRPGRGPRPAARPHQRARRAQRRRQVDAGQRAGARRRPRRRHRQRGHRSRPAHLDVGATCCALPGRRRLDHRHPRHPVVRARARAARGPDRGVPRPRRDDRGLPARLHARHRRARVRARRGGRRRATADPDRVESFRRLLAAREGAAEC